MSATPERGQSAEKDALAMIAEALQEQIDAAHGRQGVLDVAVVMVTGESHPAWCHVCGEARVNPAGYRHDRGCAAGVAPTARCTCPIPPGTTDGGAS